MLASVHKDNARNKNILAYSTYFWTHCINLCVQIKNSKLRNTKQHVGPLKTISRESINVPPLCLTPAQPCCTCTGFSHPFIPSMTPLGWFRMVIYLQGLHFLLNKDEFPSFYISRGNASLVVISPQCFQAVTEVLGTFHSECSSSGWSSSLLPQPWLPSLGNISHGPPHMLL